MSEWEENIGSGLIQIELIQENLTKLNKDLDNARKLIRKGFEKNYNETKNNENSYAKRIAYVAVLIGAGKNDEEIIKLLKVKFPTVRFDDDLLKHHIKKLKESGIKEMKQ